MKSNQKWAWKRVNVFQFYWHIWKTKAKKGSTTLWYQCWDSEHGNDKVKWSTPSVQHKSVARKMWDRRHYEILTLVTASEMYKHKRYFL